MQCRHCGTTLTRTLIDLGSSPPSNSYLSSADAQETVYPLKVLVCDQCWLVQTEDFVAAEDMFAGDYAYFSSYSSSWLAHAEAYVNAMVARFELNDQHHVVEIAANDGYLLQYVAARDIPCLGIEPTHETAQAARGRGIEIVEAFFGVALGRKLAGEGRSADLMAANNVLAHVPDINDFVGGFRELLKPGGVATFEFPHLLNLVEQCQFDTIYHEHYSYLSLSAVASIFAANGLAVFDVEPLPTHGGSLRVYAQRADTGSRETSDAVKEMLAEESRMGLRTAEYYEGFQPRAERIRDGLLSFLAECERNGSRLGAYGAAAKGNTLLNFAGVTAEQVSYVADLNPAKQGKFLPGSHVPVVDEAHLRAQQPEYVLILPWNLTDEIVEQLSYVREWGGRFVVAIPELTIL